VVRGSLKKLEGFKGQKSEVEIRTGNGDDR
jgi:hypothetical protein